MIVRSGKLCELGNCAVLNLLDALREGVVKTESEGVYISNEYFDRYSALTSDQKWYPALSETMSYPDFSLCSSLSPT